MLYSTLIGKPVDLPLKGWAYEKALQGLIRASTLTKKAPARGLPRKAKR